MKKLIRIWILLMIPGVFAAGCVYVAFQQTQREGANAPAAVAAKQAAFELADGKAPAQALPAATDMSATITPFVMVFDGSGKLIASSADDLIGKYTYPAGCLAQIDKAGEVRVTWQPAPGLRFATVGVKSADGCYVVGAYSLSESERATDNFTGALLIGCALYALGCAALLFLYYLVFMRKR